MKKWTLLLCALTCLSCVNIVSARTLTLEEYDNGKLHDGPVPISSWPYFFPGAARYSALDDASGTVGITFTGGGPGGPKFRRDVAYFIFDLSQVDFPVTSASLRLTLDRTGHFIEDDLAFAEVLDFSTTSAQELWALPATADRYPGESEPRTAQLLRAPILDSVQLFGGGSEYTVDFGSAGLAQINQSNGYLALGLTANFYEYSRLIDASFLMVGGTQLVLEDGRADIPVPGTFWLLGFGLLALSRLRL